MNETETFGTLGTYRVYLPNLVRLQSEIAKLNKRAGKLNVPPIEVLPFNTIESEPVMKDGIQVGVNQFQWITIIGSRISFNGWKLAACVEHAEEGNIIRKAPGITREFNEYRDCRARCDHCHTIRRRNQTFIVVHDDGSVKLVGSDCLSDFMGGQDAQWLAQMAEWHLSVGELCAGSEDAGFFGEGGSKALVYVPMFLNYCALATRLYGFVTSKRAKEDFSGHSQATADIAAEYAWPPKHATERPPKLEQIDLDRALAARAHVLDTLGSKPADSLSDFEHNLLTVCKCEGVQDRNLGILAYVIEYHARAIESARVQAAKGPETHFGTVGARLTAKLTYLKSSGFDTQYGHMYVHNFEGPDNSRLIWKTGTGLDYAPGTACEAKLTVKAHDLWNEHKQTKVSRLVFA